MRAPPCVAWRAPPGRQPYRRAGRRAPESATAGSRLARWRCTTLGSRRSSTSVQDSHGAFQALHGCLQALHSSLSPSGHAASYVCSCVCVVCVYVSPPHELLAAASPPLSSSLPSPETAGTSIPLLSATLPGRERAEDDGRGPRREPPAEDARSSINEMPRKGFATNCTRVRPMCV